MRYEYTPIVTDDDDENDEMCRDVLSVMTEVRHLLRENILAERTRLRNIKWHIACRIKFIKTVLDGETGNETHTSQVVVFHGRRNMLLTDDGDELDSLSDESYEKIFDSTVEPHYNGLIGAKGLL